MIFDIMKRVIAIDGPAGAGKSTVARLVAKELGYIYIDTGAMYRAVAWKVLQQNKEATDDMIAVVCDRMEVSLSYENGATVVKADGQNITEEIRQPAVSAIVSQVAKICSVRAKLVEQQRKMAKNTAVVMDGRDIGTNVLPQADLKIFLTASNAERAQRRWKELKSKGCEVDYHVLEKDIAARDKMDSEREISPLVQIGRAHV